MNYFQVVAKINLILLNYYLNKSNSKNYLLLNHGRENRTKLKKNRQIK
jgi:hypothetical protein